MLMRLDKIIKIYFSCFFQVGKLLKAALADGKSVSVSVLSACGTEKIVALKEATA